MSLFISIKRIIVDIINNKLIEGSTDHSKLGRHRAMRCTEASDVASIERGCQI